MEYHHINLVDWFYQTIILAVDRRSCC